MSEPVFKDTQREETLARLYQVLKDRPNLEAMTGALGDRVQAMEDVFESLYYLRWLDTGQGEQLNVIGRNLGLPRDGRDDDAYRVALRAWIFALGASGTFQDLGQLMLLVDPDATFAVKAWVSLVTGETIPGAVEIRFYTSLSEQDGTTAQIMAREAKAAGIRIDLVYSPDVTEAFTFTPDDTPVSTTTFGFADSDTPTTGGFFVPSEVV